MSLEEAMMQPFFDEHQPSLQNLWRQNNLVMGDVALGNRKARSYETQHPNKLAQDKLSREVFKCKENMKSLILPSATSPSRMKLSSIIDVARSTTQAIRLCHEYAII
jgi:hypothetical protein